ncbi:class E sortase [Saccharomonospora cyanea]|uniref:Sortase (Surface protein transpeptidase) n=1 Tax=Saccharomonospora cyanea NA-134 TaxID=882082 RepID=H5XPF9_9PSEU|nr:class E sortase [Saccharomonospora cyanea]EHR58993.1 sortase (surface protein transpeptidase) [Saccharomonospora cyanea NA-134]
MVEPLADAPTRPVMPPVARRQARPEPVPPSEPDEAPPESDAPEDPPEEPPAPKARPGRGGGGRARAAVRTFGEILITLGIVVLLFVVYELWVTNLMSQELQRDASADLDQRWSQQREMHTDPMDGEAFARMYIPSFGVDWNFTIQQGVDAATLEIGPGHYKKTAMPGEPGNFAVAGHRVGKGAPFNDLDLLGSCDAVVIETVDTFFVYRVLPMSDEVQGWAQGKGGDPRCEGVRPLTELDPAYGETVGRRIVLPTRGDAVAPVPYQADSTLPEEQQVELLTLTTCHPRFSDRERMIIHGVLTHVYEKEAGATYDQLLKEIGEV